MRIRRCGVLFLEAREEVEFDLDVLLSGGDGLRRSRHWVALAPHRGEEVKLNDDERGLLGELSPSQWQESSTLEGPPTTLGRLLEEGLVITEDERYAHWRTRDERLRATYWHPLAATLHVFTRWTGVDTVRNSHDSGTETASRMREVLGAPPPETARRADGDGQLLALPRSGDTDFDRLLARRATCRNFDPGRKVPLELFAQLLQRVFAVQAEVRISDDMVFLKKNVPSGGGLHPMECYLVVQHVDGVEPGMYHYQSREHALEPLCTPNMPMRELIMSMVSQQHWFADAHVLVVLSPRFDRTFWKYRHHAKGYRVVALEGGHLSQMLYLAATEAGLGAFITSAINEVEVERHFGLDAIHQGALAICGFGWRAGVMEAVELDPAAEVWKLAQ